MQGTFNDAVAERVRPQTGQQAPPRETHSKQAANRQSTTVSVAVSKASAARERQQSEAYGSQVHLDSGMQCAEDDLADDDVEMQVHEAATRNY